MRLLTTINALMLVAATLVGGAAAQDNPWQPESSIPQLPTIESTIPAELLAHYAKTLQAQYEAVAPKALSQELFLYARAVSAIAEANYWYKAKPQNPQARSAFATCSLVCQAAWIQLKAVEVRLKQRQLLDSIALTLNELNAVHETINEIERSHATQLKLALDEQKQRADEQKQRADEEKRRAQAIQAEAEKKFEALQSELIKVHKDARGTIISMSDILFDVGKATLTPVLQTSLAKISGILTVYREANIVVEGHTDTTGSEVLNQRLSEERANNVLTFLVEQGIDMHRLSAVGYGFNRPIADNATKEGRQKNRRVDLVIQDTKVAKLDR
jgi:outer membrane protein OmpA-like peptidoglycan-associated protein